MGKDELFKIWFHETVEGGNNLENYLMPQTKINFRGFKKLNISNRNQNKTHLYMYPVLDEEKLTMNLSEKKLQM